MYFFAKCPDKSTFISFLKLPKLQFCIKITNENKAPTKYCKCFLLLKV